MKRILCGLLLVMAGLVAAPAEKTCAEKLTECVKKADCAKKPKTPACEACQAQNEKCEASEATTRAKTKKTKFPY